MHESEWAADNVERRSVADLIENARNARTHSESQVNEIVASIRQWGWTNPVLIEDDGTIVAGHGRVLAARVLELDEVPCMIVPDWWTEADRRAYALADNQIPLNAGWDSEVLKLEFGELKALDFDLALTGFSPDAIVSFDVPAADPGASTRGGEGAGAQEQGRKTLLERFGLAPFSVLSARGGWWQERKRAWLSLGIESEVGRGENLLRFSDTINEPDPEKRAAKKGLGGTPANLAIGGGGLCNQVGKVGEKTKNVTPGNGWGNGGPARRDPAFYAKKREWEAANGRKISTTEFREKHWDGRA